MKIINATFEIIDNVDPIDMMKKIEKIGRVCYKSEDKITQDSSENFIKGIIKRGHESVIEHEKISVRIICDRGVSHEIVRHRIASYSQESTRYCNYSKDNFGNELTFIRPVFWDEDSKEFNIWKQQMQEAENKYIDLINLGAKPEQARSILPNSLKTEIVMTMNLREWRHFFKLRTSKNAHPQMREISIKIFEKMREMLPPIFYDIDVDC